MERRMDWRKIWIIWPLHWMDSHFKVSEWNCKNYFIVLFREFQQFKSNFKPNLKRKIKINGGGRTKMNEWTKMMAEMMIFDAKQFTGTEIFFSRTGFFYLAKFVDTFRSFVGYVWPCLTETIHSHTNAYDVTNKKFFDLKIKKNFSI